MVQTSRWAVRLTSVVRLGNSFGERDSSAHRGNWKWKETRAGLPALSQARLMMYRPGSKILIQTLQLIYFIWIFIKHFIRGRREEGLSTAV